MVMRKVINWRVGQSESRKVGKKGQILVENVIFLVLNLAFLSILILFLIKQGSSTVFMEETYSKQIALLIDSAKPGILMLLNMNEAMEIAREKGFPVEDIVTINGQYVTVRLSEKSGQDYHFFNKVKVGAYPDVIEGRRTGMYVLTFGVKRTVEEPVS